MSHVPREMSVVWLKRDLRVTDHAPLVEACARGEVLVLYVVEPELIAQPETDPSHVAFVAASLAELREALRARGGELVVRTGALPDVFEDLHQRRPIRALYSHEETGNGLTYARDKRVARWAKERGVHWVELPQTGVFRPLRTRDGWAARWAERMRAPLVATPDRVPSVRVADLGLEPGPIPDEKALGLPASSKRDAQRGGAHAARVTLDGFFADRGEDYAKALSSPVTGWEGCSRLSVYLAHGNLSLREVVHAAAVKKSALEGDASPRAKRWRMSLAALEARLRWHCHFVQKLEDEPRLEHENLARSADGLREPHFREDLFGAWARGETGYPMVDACMRALLATGWINFRMRAMVVSFASYDLWLHWRRTGLHLARHFLDFEPGIHWSQMQMQSGTTGINTLRMYSPTKQLLDHDPEGVFVRRWVPELARLPRENLAEPWNTPPLLQRAASCIIGRDYPAPIVDHVPAVAEARRRLARVRSTTEARAEAAAIVQKHGSRKKPSRRSPRRAPAK